MIGYIHIYVDGEQVYNWRFFKEDDELPKVGEEIELGCHKMDIRYLVESIEQLEKIEGYPDTYRLHCKDLSKEVYGPWRQKTEAGWFHEMDKNIMKMYPEYKKGDYV